MCPAWVATSGHWRKSMERKTFKTTGWGPLALIAALSAAWQGQAQEALQSAGCTIHPAHYLQEDGDGIGGIIQSSDDRQHQGRIR